MEERASELKLIKMIFTEDLEATKKKNWEMRIFGDNEEGNIQKKIQILLI